MLAQGQFLKTMQLTDLHCLADGQQDALPKYPENIQKKQFSKLIELIQS